MSTEKEIKVPAGAKWFGGFMAVVVAVAVGGGTWDGMSREGDDAVKQRITTVVNFFEKAAGIGCDDARAWPRMNTELKNLHTASGFQLEPYGQNIGKFDRGPLKADLGRDITNMFKKLSEDGYRVCFDKQLNIDDGNYRFASVIYPQQKVISIASFFNSEETARIMVKAAEYVGKGNVANDEHGGVHVLVSEGKGVVERSRTYYNPTYNSYWQKRDDKKFPTPPVM